VTITAHVAPGPFSFCRHYPAIEVLYDTPWEFFEKVTHIELVVSYPPLEPNRSEKLAKSPTSATLEVIAPIAVKDGRGPQLVLCTVTPDDGTKRPFQAVAKICDALYYSFGNKDMTKSRFTRPWRPIKTTPSRLRPITISERRPRQALLPPSITALELLLCPSATEALAGSERSVCC
jgi:hypothetical protein